MKILFLGPPGAGKGTQASAMKNILGIPHISTGDIFRSEMKQNTPLGAQAKSYVERGDLVPDSLVIEMVQHRISQDDCANGFILDGFPRTLAQAQALDERVNLDVALNFIIPDEVLVKRISDRRICRECASIFRSSEIDSLKCKVCGGELYQRPDDSIETVSNRLKVYYEQTNPLKNFYKDKGKLFDIDADKEIDAVQADALEALEKAKK